MKRKGKIVYVPAERAITKAYIEETPHGYRLFREGEERHFAIIPLSKMVSIEFYEVKKNE